MEFKHKCIQHTRRETDQAIIVTSKLSKLANDVEEFIDFDEDDPPTLSTSHQILLNVLYHESIISLNRPIVASHGSGSEYNAALQHCIGSARSIITALHRAIKPAPSQSQATFPLLWPSFTWAVWMSTFILFHAANNQHASEATVSRYVAIHRSCCFLHTHTFGRLAERSLDIFENLSRRGSVWPEACAAAIRDLRSQLMRKGNIGATDVGTKTVDKSKDSLRSQTHLRASSDRNVPYGRSATSPHVISHPSEQPTPCLDLAGMRDPSTTSNMDLTSSNQANVQFPWSAGLEHFPQQPENLDGSLGGPDLSDPSQSNNPNRSAIHLQDFAQNGIGIDRHIPLPNDDGLDPFAGFDIPFWLGQDQYSGMVNEWS